ncbi:MAG TPA: PH domain-containing protein [Candidatus Binatia bacterium]|nr:PH domain-containing protein [Candidatus Binatia bacterium]
MFRTRLHPVLFGGAAWFTAFVVLVVTLVIRHNELSRDATVRLVLGAAAVVLASLVTPYTRWRTSEFAVTDRRVLVKVGLVSVHTVELLLQKVETIGVDQTFVGRLLGYGTLRITGTGGTVETFPLVSAPFALRDAVLAQAPRAAARTG